MSQGQTHFHAVVWIDHTHARVAFFDAEDATLTTLRSHGEPHVHHQAGVLGAGHATADPRFLAEVAAAIAPAGEVLVCGPGLAKAEFLRHLDAHAPAVRRKVVAGEPSDHPSDGELVDHARRFFKVADRTTPQRPQR